MPKVVLDLESNLEEFFNVLSRGEELVSKTGAAVVELGKDSKVAFSMASGEADKFSNEVKSGTKLISAMDAAAKGMNKVFNDTGNLKGLDEKKIAIADVKKRIDDLLVYEKKLIEQQDKAGSSKIKDQFAEPISKAQEEVEALRKKLLGLNDVKITPEINISKNEQVDAVKNELNKVQNTTTQKSSTDNTTSIKNTGAINIVDDQEITQVKHLTDELKKLDVEKNKIEDDKKSLVSTDNKAVSNINAVEKSINELKNTTQEANKTFNQVGNFKSLEERKVVISDIKKQIEDLISYEKKLTEQQSKAGPSNIKEQFTEPITQAQQQISELRKKLLEVSETKITPKIDLDINDRIREVKAQLASLNSEQSSIKEDIQNKTSTTSKSTSDTSNSTSSSSTSNNDNSAAARVSRLTDELKQLEIEKKKLENDDKPLVPPVDKPVNELKRLKAEIKSLLSQALELKAQGDIIGANEAINKAGHLRDELKDVQDAVKSVAGNVKENFAGAFGKATQIAAEGFEGLLAVENLVGEKNEDFEKQLLKLQSIQSIARIAGEFGDLGDRLNEIKLGLKPVTDLYTRGNDAIKNFFKANKTGAVEAIATNKSLSASIAGGIKSFVTSGIAGIKSLWATIAANPLGVILVAVGGLITAIVTLRDKIKPFQAIFEFFAKGFDALFDNLEKLGQAFGIVASENEKANKKIIESTEEVLDVIKRFYDFQIKLAEARNKSAAALEEDQTTMLKHALQDRLTALKDIEKENGKLNEEQIKQRKEFLNQIEDLENESSVRLIKFQRENRDYVSNQEKEARLSRLNALKDGQAKEEALLKENYQTQVEEIKKDDGNNGTIIAGFEEDAYKAFKANQDRLKAAEEKYRKDLSDIAYKYYLKRKEELKQLLELENSFRNALVDLANKTAASQAVTGEQKVNVEKHIALQSLTQLRDSLIKQGQAVEDFQAKIEERKAKTFTLASEQEEQLSILTQNVYRDATNKLIALEVERQNKLASLTVDQSKTKEEIVTTQETNAISAVELTQKPKDTSEIDFELEKQKAILKIQQDYAIKKLELQKATLDAENAQQVKALNGQLAALGDRNDAEAQLERENVIRSLELLQAKFAEQGTAIQDATAKLVNDLQKQLDSLKQPVGIDLYKLLGIKNASDVDHFFQAIDSIGEALSSFVNLEQQRLDKEIQQSDTRQQQNDKDIQDLQNKLTKEQDLASQGKANNSALIEAQLAEKQAAQAKEAQIQQKDLEQKKAYQKQQLTIDTITQTSGLVTASANILATTARDPVSLAIALVAIGAMITGFAAAKVNAYKAVNEGLNLKDGDVDIDGPGTETSDSIKANLSKGESVTSAKQTRKYKDILIGIKKDNPLMIAHGLLKSVLKGTGVTLPHDLASRISNKREAVRENEIKIMVHNNYNELLAETRANTKAVERVQDELKNRVYTNEKGATVYQKGSHKHIVIKK